MRMPASMLQVFLVYNARIHELVYTKNDQVEISKGTVIVPKSKPTPCAGQVNTKALQCPLFQGYSMSCT